MSSLTTITISAQLPDLFMEDPSLLKAIFCINSSSVCFAACLIASGMFCGNSGWFVIFMWNVSFMNSTHSLPPWPSKTQKI